MRSSYFTEASRVLLTRSAQKMTKFVLKPDVVRNAVDEAGGALLPQEGRDWETWVKCMA